jgi:hypothetical protein
MPVINLSSKYIDILPPCKNVSKTFVKYRIEKENLFRS